MENEEVTYSSNDLVEVYSYNPWATHYKKLVQEATSKRKKRQYTEQLEIFADLIVGNIKHLGGYMIPFYKLNNFQGIIEDAGLDKKYVVDMLEYEAEITIEGKKYPKVYHKIIISNKKLFKQVIAQFDWAIHVKTNDELFVDKYPEQYSGLLIYNKQIEGNNEFIKEIQPLFNGVKVDVLDTFNYLNKNYYEDYYNLDKLEDSDVASLIEIMSEGYANKSTVVFEELFKKYVVVAEEDEEHVAFEASILLNNDGSMYKLKFRIETLNAKVRVQMDKREIFINMDDPNHPFKIEDGKMVNTRTELYKMEDYIYSFDNVNLELFNAVAEFLLEIGLREDSAKNALNITGYMNKAFQEYIK